MKRIIFSLISILCWQVTILGQVLDCSNYNYFNNASILIPEDLNPTLDDQPIPSGSIIKVLFDNNGTMACAGFIEWTGQNTILTAGGQEPGVPGFDFGEAFNYAIQLPDGCTIDNVLVSYGQNSITNSMGNFTVNGINLLASFDASSTLLAEADILPDT